jgi:hypothetical protein
LITWFLRVLPTQGYVSFPVYAAMPKSVTTIFYGFRKQAHIQIKRGKDGLVFR